MRFAGLPFLPLFASAPALITAGQRAGERKKSTDGQRRVDLLNGQIDVGQRRPAGLQGSGCGVLYS